MIKNPPADAGAIGDVVSITGLGRSPGVGNGNPLHYSCLENSMDGGAWQATVHGVEKESETTEHTCTSPGPGLGRCPGEGIGYPLEYC